MEDASQLCAMVCASRDKVMAKYPIDQEKMDNFVQLFVDRSNIHLELELQSELQLKNPSFAPEEHIQGFKSMVESHQKTSVESAGA